MWRLLKLGLRGVEQEGTDRKWARSYRSQLDEYVEVYRRACLERYFGRAEALDSDEPIGMNKQMI